MRTEMNDPYNDQYVRRPPQGDIMTPFTKLSVNLMLNNLLPNVREVADALTSPQRKVAKIVKSHTNSYFRTPTSWLELECGHSVKPIYVNSDIGYLLDGGAHRDSNHMAQPGDVLGCPRCRSYETVLARLKALKPGDVQHARFRTRDNRGFGEGDYYVYVRDVTSPTGVKLLCSIDATKEADEVLRALRASPLSPTEAR